MKNRKIRLALLGMCNSKNVLEHELLKDIADNVFYAFQPCYFDITDKNNGLGIPYKDFYKTPIGNAYRDSFTKKTMQMDLNKTTLTAIETINPDYLVVDLGSLNMKTYKMSYKDKTVLSRNAFAPLCYEDLKTSLGDAFSFEETLMPEDSKTKAVYDLCRYLESNWDLSKVILFVESVPVKFISSENEEKVITHSNYSRQWEIEAIKRSAVLAELAHNFFKDKVQVFYDVADKTIALEPYEANLVPSAHHASKETRVRQAQAFKDFITHISTS